MGEVIGVPKPAQPLKLPRLPRGITGFDQTTSVQQTSERRFKAACYSVARYCEGAVVDTAHCRKRIACSYLAVTIERRLSRVSILANRFYPLVAFVADGAYDRIDPKFIDDESLAEAFRQLSGFQPLDLEFLNLAIDANMVADLGSYEHKQLKHWTRGIHHFQFVGQIIFNTWD